HLLLAQHLARREEAVEDRVADLLVDLLGQRNGRRDEKFWRHRYCTSFPWPVSSSKTYNPAKKVLWRSYHLRSRTGCRVRSTGTWNGRAWGGEGGGWPASDHPGRRARRRAGQPRAFRRPGRSAAGRA